VWAWAITSVSSIDPEDFSRVSRFRLNLARRFGETSYCVYNGAEGDASREFLDKLHETVGHKMPEDPYLPPIFSFRDEPIEST
jgi:hypothetical protein